MIEYLHFLHTTVELDVDADVASFEPVRRFFRHVLVASAPAAPATFRVTVTGYRPERDVPAEVWELPLVDVRRSNAPEFTFQAHVVDHGRRRTYVNRTTWLDTPRDVREDDRFELRITSGSTIQVIDFLRDLVIRNEEQLGTVVLHASGVTDGRSVLAVAGPKGAGKTTALLSMARHPGWSYFTGDKMFCRIVDGGVEVYPWRDYPYVGVGTILADERLTALVRGGAAPDVEQRPASHKILLDPDVFEEWLGSPFDPTPRPLRALLLPRVQPGLPLGVEELAEPNERWAALQKAIDRQADTTFFTWQSYLVPDYTAFFASLAQVGRALAGVPFVRLTGTLDVDPGALLAELGGAAEAGPAQAPAGERSPLRLAIIGTTGSGKSTVAGMIEDLVAGRGLRSARIKLAAPLYRLQDVVYRAAGRQVSPGAQDQQLMEALATALRRANPTSIVDDFLGRLAGSDADVVINDDLRDPDVDAPALAARGFRVVRVRTTEELRAKRLADRGDLTRSEGSTARLDAIPPDVVIDNIADLDTLRAAVTATVGGWL